MVEPVNTIIGLLTVLIDAKDEVDAEPTSVTLSVKSLIIVLLVNPLGLDVWNVPEILMLAALPVLMV